MFYFGYLLAYLLVMLAGTTITLMVGSSIRNVLDDLVFYNCILTSFTGGLVYGFTVMPFAVASVMLGPFSEWFCMGGTFLWIAEQTFLFLSFLQSCITSIPMFGATLAGLMMHSSLVFSGTFPKSGMQSSILICHICFQDFELFPGFLVW